MKVKNVFFMMFLFIFCFLPFASADDRSDYPDVDETAFHMTDPLDPDQMIISSGGDFFDYRKGHRDNIHGAIDFAAIEGAPVYASASGTAYYQYQASGGGNMVFIDHGGRELFTTYMHLSEVNPDIQNAGDMYDGSEGVHIEQAQYIGKVGHTGGDYGPHLHFQICSGAPFARNAISVLNPHDWLSGLPATSGSGYGHMSPSMKFKFDAAVDFFKPVKVFIDKFGEISTKAMELLAGTVAKVMAILFVIDFAIGACMRAIDPSGSEGAGTNIFTWLAFKALIYLLLIFFLTHWGEYVGNLSKTMFTSFGAMAFGSGTAETAQQAVANPFDIFQKGVLLVEPLINNFINMSWFKMWLNFQTFVFTMFFSVAILFMLAVIVYQIALVYIEFYIMMLFSFATFMFAGIKQGRSFAARGVNGVFAVSLKLMFYSMFSLMLQGFFADLKVPQYFETTETPLVNLQTGNIPKDPTAEDPHKTSNGNKIYMNQDLPPSEDPRDEEAGITDMNVLIAHIQAQESSGNWHVRNWENRGSESAAYGAFQILPSNWKSWTEFTEEKNGEGTLETKEDNCSLDDQWPNYHEPSTGSPFHWTHNNQYFVARTMLVSYYLETRSYRLTCESWYGVGSRNTKDGEKYWYKVSHRDPITGAFL